MDNKTIALVGALLVLGVAVYGMATGNVPGFSQFGEEPAEQNGAGDGGGTNDDGTQNVNNGNSQENTGEGNTSDGGGNETESDGEEEIQELATSTEFTEEELRGMEQNRVEELLRRSRLTEVCENQGEDYEAEQGNVPVRGPAFNPFMFENMVHNEMNDLRESRTDAEPLNCDPVLREIARDKSEMSAKDVGANSTAMRYEGVCENPSETTGSDWYYLLDTELSPPDGTVNQRQTVIEDHDDLLRDVRARWINGAPMDAVTDREATRQGVGAYMNRDTREIFVTHVTC